MYCSYFTFMTFTSKIYYQLNLMESPPSILISKATLPFFWEIILMDASPNITVNISRHANVASIFGNTQCQSSWTSQPLYSTIELRDKNALASLLSSYCYIIQTTVVVGETFSISLYILKLYTIFEPFNRPNNTP